KSNPYTNTINYKANYLDNNIGKGDKDRDKDRTKYKPYTIGPNPGFNRGDIYFRQ
ncbi:hypothetical protein V2W45_1236764, partial [Cenococcum geophilum]